MSEILTRCGIPNHRNPEKSDRAKLIQWDIQATIKAKTFTIEAKFDQMESKTGNLAIEYFNVKQGKPSGIMATTSDIWAVVLQKPMTAWFANTHKLREYFERVKPVRDIACGGDNNAAMKLYRREEILAAVFHQIDALDRVTMRKLVCHLVSENSL